jgi:PAS domain S-box-containing protein
MSAKPEAKLQRQNRILREQVVKIQRRYEEKIAELSMIREMGATLLYIRSFERACRFILHVVIQNTVAQNCSIMLLDPNANRLFLVAAADPEGNPFVLESWRAVSRVGVHYTFAMGEGAAGRALEEQALVSIPDVSRSADFAQTGKNRVKLGSLLAVPLIVEDLPLGVLNLSHPETEAFNSNENKLFEIIANFVALSIHSTLSYERLEASERKYRSLAENLHDGVATLQGNTHLYANPRYREITGLDLETLAQTPFDLLVEGPEAQPFLQELHGLAIGESLHSMYELILHTPDGRRLDTEINASAFDHNGQTARMISVRDVTERKALERHVEQARKTEALAAVAGGVAHDLNNVLGGLISYPDLMLFEIAEDSPLRQPLLTVKKSGEKAARIVQDLLTLARRGVAAREIVNLNDLVKEYLESPEYTSLKAYHPRVEVTTRLDANLWNVSGSPVHLSKTLMNLVSNAAEAMPDGGAVLISTRNRSVSPSSDPAGDAQGKDAVVLSVADQGKGIAEDEIQRIFEPFFTKKVMGRSGTGLGMSVVKGTVDDHGGQINVQSRPGLGTTFTLHFPATQATKKDSKEARGPDAFRGQGESILVVDDVEEQRRIAEALLGRLGYSTWCVPSGEEAVESVKTQKPDLVLLDMIMDPGMDGLETYRHMLALYPELPAVLVSGYTMTQAVRDARDLESILFLKKPYALDSLGTTVRQALSRAVPA